MTPIFLCILMLALSFCGQDLRDFPPQGALEILSSPVVVVGRMVKNVAIGSPRPSISRNQIPVVPHGVEGGAGTMSFSGYSPIFC
jgi:hypothetical protein